MRSIALRLAAAACFLPLAAQANATVEISFAGTTHAGSTAVPVGIPIFGSFSYDETSTSLLYGGSPLNYAGYSSAGSAQYTVEGQTHIYTLTSIFLNDTGAVVFDFANGSDILHITEFTSNTEITAIPGADVLIGPLTFLVSDFPNQAGASVEVNAEVRAVPEPATWAMILFGFAGVGVAFRRRRRTLLAA